MNLYEKKVAQMERKEPKHKYIVTRTPITNKAKKRFGGYQYSNKKEQSNRLEAEAMEHNKRKMVEFEFTFFYDDPKETEREREAEALRHSQESLNRFSSNKLVINVDYAADIKKVNI